MCMRFATFHEMSYLFFKQGQSLNIGPFSRICNIPGMLELKVIKV